MVYGCDAPWWRHRKGLPEFDGFKVTWAGNGLAGHKDIRRVEIATSGGPEKYSDGLHFDGRIGGGRNSGFQTLNLALMFGARRIILVGFDMTDRSGAHWYGRNTWPMANNPHAAAFGKWIAAFDAAVPALRGMGAEVVNTSQHSALRCFPKRSIADVLLEWS